MPGSPSGSRGVEAGRTSAPRCLRTTTRRQSSPENADLVWQGEPNELVRVRGRAVHWLRRAAELAKRRSEFDEAVVLLTRAVELCDDPHEGALLGSRSGLQTRFASTATLAGRRWRPRSTACWTTRSGRTRLLVARFPDLESLRDVRMQTVPELVDGWADRALELAAPESDARARALIARVNIEPSGRAEDAELAGVLAEASGDSVLRSFALQVRRARGAGRGPILGRGGSLASSGSTRPADRRPRPSARRVRGDKSGVLPARSARRGA